jgi:hypothetical protein
MKFKLVAMEVQGLSLSTSLIFT